MRSVHVLNAVHLFSGPYVVPNTLPLLWFKGKTGYYSNVAGVAGTESLLGLPGSSCTPSQIRRAARGANHVPGLIRAALPLHVHASRVADVIWRLEAGD